MKRMFVHACCALALLIVLVTPGCVAPPTETESGSVDLYDPNQFASQTNGVDSYVTEATLFGQAPTQQGPTYATFAPTTRIPEDQSCLINPEFLKKRAYGYNGSAVEFNLKNPPMYINYSVIPKNITEKRFERTASGDEELKEFDIYSPSSWFSITIRNKNTGEIYEQGGFGKEFSYYQSGTIKTLRSGELLIEFNGNDIQAAAGIWVKPYGNFDNPEDMSFAECKYWDSARSIIDIPTSTPTPAVNF